MENFMPERQASRTYGIFRNMRATPHGETEYKGSAVSFLRGLMSKQPESIRAAFEQKLSAEDLQLFRATMAVSTVPIASANSMYIAAVEVLYADESRNQGLRKLGKELARDNLSGIYRLLLKVLSVEMLIDQCAKLWRTYHSSGEASVNKRSADGHYDFVVKNSPDLPEPYREFVCGYIEGAVTLTGGKDARVVKGGDPSAWTWDVSWR